MNGKRWLAIGIATLLLLISSIINGQMNGSIYQRKGILENLLSEEIVEKTLHEGNKQERIAVIFIDGVISSANAAGLFSNTGYHHSSVLKQIKTIQQDDTVKGVVLSVNSPGGGTFESAQLKDALRTLQEKKQIPVYVSMQKMATSGGYYISAYADKIFATEETLTGSIGVIMSGINLSGLYQKLGISDDTIKSGEFKDIGSDSRPMTAKDRDILQRMIDLSYQRFVKVVSEGRNMELEKAKALADGRIYDGSQAKENGLIDEIGYFDDVVEQMKLDHLLNESQVFYYDIDKSSINSFLGMTIQHFFNTSGTDFSKWLQPYSTDSMIRPMYIYRGE